MNGGITTEEFLSPKVHCWLPKNSVGLNKRQINFEKPTDRSRQFSCGQLHSDPNDEQLAWRMAIGSGSWSLDSAPRVLAQPTEWHVEFMFRGVSFQPIVLRL